MGKITVASASTIRSDRFIPPEPFQVPSASQEFFFTAETPNP